MVMQALTCSNCGAPVRPASTPVIGGLATCGFCGTQLALAVPAGPSPMAIVLMSIGPRRLDIIKCIRSFSALGLAEAVGLLENLPATISITERDMVPAEIVRE